MKLGLLSAQNCDYDVKTWRDYEALYRGGRDFRRRVRQFLAQNQNEPEAQYDRRCNDARYLCYVGPIVDYFASQLMAAPMTVHATNGVDPDVIEADPFYASFKEDVDGLGTDLVDFAREGFRQALIKQWCWWLVSMPSDGGRAPKSLAEWESRGLGRAVLRFLDAERVVDWELDEVGELLWAITFDESHPRSSPAASRSLTKLTFRIYDRAQVHTFEKVFDPKETQLKEDDEIPLKSSEAHGFERVPLVRVMTPHGLWLLNRVADAQVAHFQVSSGLKWAIRTTCYAMPVFRLEEDTQANRSPLGAGYYLKIGTNENVDWLSPPAESFGVIADKEKSLKDEIYRVAQQMAAGVDNNAAAVGRSAESKIADSSATEVCLKAYGAIIREAIDKVYALVIEGRREKDKLKISVSGLDRFSLADAAITVGNTEKAKALEIPSATFTKELYAQVAESLLPSLDQEKKDAIRAEIAEGVDAEAKAEKDEAKQEADNGGSGEDGMMGIGKGKMMQMPDGEDAKDES